MDNLNNISYADGWKSASNPVKYEKPEHSEEPEPETKKKKVTGKPLLTVIQIIICALIILSAFVIKLIGGDIYKNIKCVYENELQNEIILNPYENGLDKLFNASQD